ncbi:MAG: PIN domain-containing protein [Peptoniphilus sp.]|nr:PIN domain-containing protein [Peptoniphilus sp.]MDY3118445.1 PIN domain-containing protein [Peptoniphilus sp.]
MGIRSNRIFHLVFRLLFTLLGLAVGHLVLGLLRDLNAIKIFGRFIPQGAVPVVVFILFAILFFILGKYAYVALWRFVDFVESEMKDVPAGDILWGVFGLLIGIVIAFLVSLPIYRLNIAYISSFLSLIIYVVLGVLGIRIMLYKREEIAQSVRNLLQGAGAVKLKGAEKKQAAPKLLDTSVIIDGRIVDIIELGFMEGPIVVPSFVLSELQGIADSSNTMSRTKGRKGLDALKKLQDDSRRKIKIVEKNYNDLAEVDTMLLRMAKEMKGVVVTNDFNLNKVADVQGIRVLNINALANAMKPVFVTGEVTNVFVVKPGSQDKQGLGYLDDGTMIVVENGIDYIGHNVDCTVTSMLQTAAGKMIFAKPVN